MTCKIEIGHTCTAAVEVHVEVVAMFAKADLNEKPKLFVLRRSDNSKLIAGWGYVCEEDFGNKVSIKFDNVITEHEFKRMFDLVASGKACGENIGAYPLTYVPNWTLQVDCMEICGDSLEVLEKWVKGEKRAKARPKTRTRQRTRK